MFLVIMVLNDFASSCVHILSKTICDNFPSCQLFLSQLVLASTKGLTLNMNGLRCGFY